MRKIVKKHDFDDCGIVKIHDVEQREIVKNHGVEHCEIGKNQDVAPTREPRKARRAGIGNLLSKMRALLR